jgi:N-acetylglucosaminyldiphosphoundecaprenol N-acetyl-beta-D-mannosaminyltransferase
VDQPIGVEGTARIRVLDLPIDDVPEKHIIDVLTGMLAEKRVHQIVLLSLWDLMRARRDPELRKLVANASLVIPTTAGVVRGASFLRHHKPTRYTSFDFVVRLLGALEQKNGSLYILGGARGDVATVEENLKLTFPGVRLVGRYSGDHPRSMEANIVTAIRKAAPNVLLAGTKLSGEDKWIYRRRESFAPGIFVYSGECFDVFAEKRSRPVRSPAKQLALRFVASLWHPWRIVTLPVYGWFWVRLFFRRLSKR